MKIGDGVKWFQGVSPQRGQSFLYAMERRAAQAIARAAPEWAQPSYLSLLGAVGAAFAAAALVGSHSWPNLIWLVPPAMFVNWFGLTADLPLARLRSGELPGSGMAHHVAELFSHVLIIVAYGFSPFLSLRAAAIILVCYLLFSSYCYIRAATRHVQQMAYIGIGVTEFRILVAFWPFVAIALGVPASLHDPLPGVDIAVMALAFMAVLGLFGKLFQDGRRIAAASAHAAPGREE